MESALYYCDTHQLSLGATDSYKLDWNQSKTASVMAITDSKLISDEFGDDWISASCTTSSKNVPIITFRYQQSCGDTGFGDFSKNGAGLSPDKELQHFFNAILVDAWTWSHQRNEFICYATEKSKLEYPGAFFYGKELGTPLISVHSPSAELIKQFSESNATAIYKSHGIGKLKALFQLASECEMVLVWQLSYGTNPIAISANIDAVLKKFSTLCTHEAMALKQVETEDDLPAW